MPDTQSATIRVKPYMFVGIFLTLLPLLLVFYHAQRMVSGTIVRLPVHVKAVNAAQLDLTKFGANYRLTTPLNSIDTDMVTGQNSFSVNTPIYVFLSPGPNDIWYAYSISKHPPQHGCQLTSCLVLKGRVQAVDGHNIDVHYQYEDFAAPPYTAKKLKGMSAHNSELVLSIGANGRAVLRALILDGENIAQPKILIPELLGLTHNIASAAPAR